MSVTQTEEEPVIEDARPWLRRGLALLCAGLLVWCAGMVAVTAVQGRWVDLAFVLAGTALVGLVAWELRPGRGQR